MFNALSEDSIQYPSAYEKVFIEYLAEIKALQQKIENFPNGHPCSAVESMPWMKDSRNKLRNQFKIYDNLKTQLQTEIKKLNEAKKYFKMFDNCLSLMSQPTNENLYIDLNLCRELKDFALYQLETFPCLTQYISDETLVLELDGETGLESMSTDIVSLDVNKFQLAQAEYQKTVIQDIEKKDRDLIITGLQDRQASCIKSSRKSGIVSIASVFGLIVGGLCIAAGIALTSPVLSVAFVSIGAMGGVISLATMLVGGIGMFKSIENNKTLGNTVEVVLQSQPGFS